MPDLIRHPGPTCSDAGRRAAWIAGQARNDNKAATSAFVCHAGLDPASRPGVMWRTAWIAGQARNDDESERAVIAMPAL
jgi:hypothetical protein